MNVVTRRFAKTMSESQEEIDKDRSLKLVEGLTTQKDLTLRDSLCCAFLELVREFRSESSWIQGLSMDYRRNRC